MAATRESWSTTWAWANGDSRTIAPLAPQVRKGRAGIGSGENADLGHVNDGEVDTSVASRRPLAQTDRQTSPRPATSATLIPAGERLRAGGKDEVGQPVLVFTRRRRVEKVHPRPLAAAGDHPYAPPPSTRTPPSSAGPAETPSRHDSSNDALNAD